MNSLHRNDYSDERWAEIEHIRIRYTCIYSSGLVRVIWFDITVCRDNWVPPESVVMDYLLNTLQYHDSRRLALTYKQQNIGINTPGKSSDTEPEGTCRYGTRIDWILFPPECTSSGHVNTAVSREYGVALHVIDYEVVETDCTDHNLVVATFTLR